MRHRNIDVNAENGVLGSKSDIHEGMGPIHQLIDIDRYVRHYNVLDLLDDSHDIYLDGDTYVCGRCGYDRGRYHTHTEIDTRHIVCDNCEGTLAEWGT